MSWPFRWALIALVFGFFGAFGMWAFDAGKDVAGFSSRAGQEVIRLRAEVEQLQRERDKAQSIANTADSLLKAEKATQDTLIAQIKELELKNASLKTDLGFFEHLLPNSSVMDEVRVRNFQVVASRPGYLRYQVLIMQAAGPQSAGFKGSYDLTLSGLLNGKPWTAGIPGGARTLHFKQYQRVEGTLDLPKDVVVKTAQVRVFDASGVQKATQATKF